MSASPLGDTIEGASCKPDSRSAARSPFPIAIFIEGSNCGLLSRDGDDVVLGEMVDAAASRRWDREAAMRYMITHHTQDRRTETYDRVIRRELPGQG